MVNGSGPYEGQDLSLFELYEKIVNSELELSNSKFDKIIKSATQKDLEKRIQNCEMFRMYLDPSYDTGEIPKLNQYICCNNVIKHVNFYAIIYESMK